MVYRSAEVAAGEAGEAIKYFKFYHAGPGKPPSGNDLRAFQYRRGRAAMPREKRLIDATIDGYQYDKTDIHRGFVAELPRMSECTTN